MSDKKCIFCGNKATKLCDFPISSIDKRTESGKVRVVKTCDLLMCDECATQWRGLDICPQCVGNIVRKAKEFSVREKELDERFKSIRERRSL